MKALKALQSESLMMNTFMFVFICFLSVNIDTSQQCEPSKKNMVLVAVVISTAVLLGIMIFLLTWTILKVPMCFSVCLLCLVPVYVYLIVFFYNSLKPQ